MLLRRVGNGIVRLHTGGSEHSAFALQQISTLWTSAAAHAASVPQQQHVRVQQHQQQQQGRSQHGSGSSSMWARVLSAAAAAAAVTASWSACSSSSSTRHAQVLADQSASQQQPYQASPRGAAAVVTCAVGPLVQLLHGLAPQQDQLSSIAAAAAAEAAALAPWELIDTVWGLAMFGAAVGIEQLSGLAAAVTSHLHGMTVYQAVVATWALTMLCSSSSSSASLGQQQQQQQQLWLLNAQLWQQLMQRLKEATLPELDEPAVLYLLHAAVQQVAVHAEVAAAASPLGNSKPSQPGLQQQQQPSLPASSPRASGAEVMSQLEQLPRKLRSRVAAAYQEYVPFHPYVEGPLLVILHTAKSMSSHVNAAAAAAAAAASDGSSGPSPYSTAFSGLSAADAAAASTLLSGHGSLGKLKRDLYYRWRSDQLLDRHQQDLNQVAYVLQRRLGLPLQQPPDVDILLPTLRTALLLDDSPTPGSTAGHSSIDGGWTGLATLTGQQLQHGVLPFTVDYWTTCHKSLLALLRNSYSAPPGGFVVKACTGIQSAKWRRFDARGWRVVRLLSCEVEAALVQGLSTGNQASHRKIQNVDSLEALLKSKLAVL